MGIGASVQARAQIQRNTAIEREMKAEEADNVKTIKLLLLGAADSGKSTILKQLRILHAQGFSLDELKAQRAVVFSNVINFMATILRAMQRLQIDFENTEREVDSNIVREALEGDTELCYNRRLTVALKLLWLDRGVRECFSRNNEYQLNDSANYFFDSLDRIMSPSYVPSQDDMLHIRVRTTTITELSFEHRGLIFRVVDVGGQRSERRKWIHFFDDTKAIIFLASLSEYDQVLYEEHTVNRMTESLTLFDTICNSKWFEKASMILFLNKKDLFAEKIQRSPLTIAFPKYTGKMTYDEALPYIKDRFVRRNQNRNKPVFVHPTCATDTNQMEQVLTDSIKTIMINNMKSFGIS